MSRRAAALLLLLLAAGLAYGWFVVPVLLARHEMAAGPEETPSPAEEELRAFVQARSPRSIFVEMETLRAWRLAATKSCELRTAYEPPETSASTGYARCHVIAALAEDQLVMIDAGSTAGVHRGLPLLLAHRDGPVPFQVNKLRVIEVLPDRAIAWVVAQSPPVRVGDEVRGWRCREYRTINAFLADQNP